MKIHLRTPTAIWSATILPLLFFGCGQSLDEPAAAPITKSPATTGQDSEPPAVVAPQAADAKKDKYAYYGKGNAYTPLQQTGRDTWIMWTGGNQKFFRL